MRKRDSGVPNSRCAARARSVASANRPVASIRTALAPAAGRARRTTVSGAGALDADLDRFEVGRANQLATAFIRNDVRAQLTTQRLEPLDLRLEFRGAALE